VGGRPEPRDDRDGSSPGHVVPVKRYSARQVERTLAKYDSVDAEIDVTPDLRLSVVQSQDAYALLDRMLESDPAGERARFPYWAEIWPSWVGRARGFAQQGGVSGRARELGCGVGVAGVALAALGWNVEATDYVEDALVFAAHNAARNGVGHRHTVGYLDWSHPVGKPLSLLVGSDLAYEKANHPYLNRVLRALLLPGGRFVLSDPARPTARPFVEGLVRSGYGHERDQVGVEWDGMQHRIDIHTFTRPDD
jgi:predicted nicotinamide N-methyase